MKQLCGLSLVDRQGRFVFWSDWHFPAPTLADQLVPSNDISRTPDIMVNQASDDAAPKLSDKGVSNSNNPISLGERISSRSCPFLCLVLQGTNGPWAT